MVRALRRVFWLAMVGGAGFAGWTALQRRNEPALTGPVADPPPNAPVGFVEVSVDASVDLPSGQMWVEPVDGACPVGYPIKGNANSGIFHVPGGRFYDRTIPERCYASAEDAEADGYRRAKA